MIRFTRSGGSEPADDEEVVVPDGGPVRIERSVAGARIGVFDRELGVAERAELTKLAQSAAAAGPSGLRARPHDAVETVEVDAVVGRFDPYRTPDDAWGPLVTALRALLDDPTTVPRAGLGIRVGPEGHSVDLARLGPGVITVTPDSLAVEARIVRDGMVASTWVPAVPTMPSEVPPGWTLRVALEPPELPASGYVEVSIDLEAGFEGPPRPRRLVGASEPLTGS